MADEKREGWMAKADIGGCALDYELLGRPKAPAWR